MTLIILKLPEMVSFDLWSLYFLLKKWYMFTSADDTMLSGEKDTKSWL